MTATDRMQLLRDKCSGIGQAEVARKISYSSAAVCQVLNGNYKGNSNNLLAKVEEIYGSSTVDCPGLSETITLRQCAAFRRRPFAAINPEWVRMYRACQTCNHNQ